MLYLIVGIPGSGKTTLSNALLKIEPSGVVHDDFIPHIYSGKLVADLRNGSDVFASDPRLCKIERCENTIKTIKQFVKNAEITLVLFPNDPTRSLNQTKNRQNAIEFYSKIYNPYEYKKFGYRVVYLRYE